MVHGSGITADPDDPPLHQRLSVRLVTPTRTRLRRSRTHARSLVPVIGADDIILPAFDDTLGDLAMRAQQGDGEARDALFFAFLPKITKMVSGVRPPFAPAGSEGIWSRDDVAQEAWFVFVELVEGWSGDVSLTAWVLSRFPWRLKDAIRRGVGKSPVPPRRFGVPIEAAVLVAWEDTGAAGSCAALDALLEVLPDPLGAILIAHVVEGKTKTEIAAELGVSRRTMVRYWQEIRVHAAAVLGR